MTVVSNDPSWWPLISSNIFYSYWMVAAGVVVIYDWALTLGQEIELIWIRYIGIPIFIPSLIISINILRMTLICIVFNSSDRAAHNAGCNIMNYTIHGTNVVVTAMLSVIMSARLHAMYQRSRMMLIFLVIIILAVNIACGVIAAMGLELSVMEELILSGTYMCNFALERDTQLLDLMVWMLNTVWEVLALFLSVWIAVKHFCDLRRLGPLTGSTIGDCFRVLIKSHVLYFASLSFLVSLSPSFLNSNSMEAQILTAALKIFLSVQLFMLGPHLILSIREYHAKLVANSDAETSMKSIVFQERVHVPTSSTV
ncbi:hypothetical protein EV702DRAFT_1215732 [Suillus placidus]|uniref:DUF6533 domain-containing protein n=1 Tax=Suillus placidus TaxID=48579 RepID=A0A9P6ZYK6_9AGAM|nr:hypothetical protein EV702DRAFT_1215732 [Suillus placidus]